MRLRFAGRHDTLLLAGLAFALLVVFHRSVRYALDRADQIEQTYGVALVPALLILTLMLVFHLHAKRSEMKAEAAASAGEAALLRARTEELERLMLFGQAMAGALSTDALRKAIARHLAAVAPGADVWVVVQNDAGWERLTDAGVPARARGEIERVADAVFALRGPRLSSPDGVVCNGHVCFPMLVGARPIGVVGIPDPDAGTDVRRKVGAAAALLSVAARNAQLFAEVRENGVRDGLTGCYNRAHALEILENELSRSKRTRSPLSIIIFDVDRFKQINDGLGHLTGDAVLGAVGHRIRQILRRSDIRCRYGGDEFLIILPETAAAGAARVAEWLRAEIEQIDIEPTGEEVRVTISVGVTTAIGGAVTAEELIERADRALYQAKAAGRNCVRIQSSTSGATTPPPLMLRPLSLEDPAVDPRDAPGGVDEPSPTTITT